MAAAIDQDPEKAIIQQDRLTSPNLSTNDDDGTSNNNISNDSDSTAEAGITGGGLLPPARVDDNVAKFEAIRPATGVSGTAGQGTADITTAGAVARMQSNKSLRSLRSISHARSNNGYGCDELPDEDVDVDDNKDSPYSSSDPESGGACGSSSGGGAVTTGNTKNPFEVQFDRSGTMADPWNPRSMSTPRKWLIVTLSSSGSFCVTCASSVYTSTYAQMDAEFGCGKLVATLGLSTFVLGIALGPMWSPLSEFYGRRPVYLFAFAAFTLFIVPCAVAQNIQTVIVSRFFQGLSGSAFLSVSGGTVGDLFRPEKMHHPMTLFTAAPFLAPSVGPLIGGFINSNVDWRWTHYMLIIWASVMFLAIFFLVPETYRKYSLVLLYLHIQPEGHGLIHHTQQVRFATDQGGERQLIIPPLAIFLVITDPVVLRNKAKSMRKETGDERWKAPIEKKNADNKSVVRTVGYSLLRPFQILAFEPMALILDLYSAIVLGILYLFFGAFPFVFEGVYGFNLWQTGLTFLGMLLGMCSGALMSGVWVKVRIWLIERDARRRGVDEGKSEPEYRLPPVIVGSALVTIGLFWFAWTTFSWVHWILPIIGSAIFGVGVSYLFLCSLIDSLISPLVPLKTSKHDCT